MCGHDDGDNDDNEEADDSWVPGIWGFEGVHASPLYKESLTLMMKKNIIVVMRRTLSAVTMIRMTS